MLVLEQKFKLHITPFNNGLLYLILTKAQV